MQRRRRRENAAQAVEEMTGGQLPQPAAAAPASPPATVAAVAPDEVVDQAASADAHVLAVAEAADDTAVGDDGRASIPPGAFRHKPALDGDVDAAPTGPSPSCAADAPYVAVLSRAVAPL